MGGSGAAAARDPRGHWWVGDGDDAGGINEMRLDREPRGMHALIKFCMI